MKKFSWQIVSLLLISMLVLAACGGQPAAEEQEEAAPAAEEKEEAAPAEEEEAAPAEAEAPVEASGGKFGLILTGPKDDNSWNEAAYTALKAIEADGVEVTFTEQTPYPDTARILRELADAGYQMIVGHSFGHQDAVFEVAEEYPAVNFAWGGGIARTGKNVADYDQPFYEAAYLVGIIAGHVSETGKLGAVYGFDIPACHSMGKAMLAGAQTVNPDTELLFTAAGDWYDISKAKEAALAQADAGVDYWVACGQGPTFGTIEAAKDQGGYATGYVGDMTEAGPEVVLTNIMWNLEPMFREMMQQTQDGTFDNPYYRFGVAEGGLDILVNPALADQIPPEALEQVEAAKAQIISGEFEVPFIPSEDAEAAPAEEEAEMADLSGGKFGLILTGPKDDNSWNEAAYTALKAIEADGVEVTFTEQTPYPDTARILRELADAGYQMIVGHSFGHQDAVFEVAEEYPAVNFAWGGGIARTGKNVADYDQPFYEAAYLVGIIAGHVSETGKLGAVYGFDIPACHSMGEAFLEGAQTVNPDTELLFTAAGDWYDISKAKEAALAQADAGVDYWVACGQGPTFGTIEAAKDQGGYATGYVGDMTEAGPEVVLTNIMWNLEPMFREMMQQTQDGTFDNPYYRFGVAEGGLDILVNPALADQIPPEALGQVEAAKAQIISGEFEVPFIPE